MMMVRKLITLIILMLHEFVLKSKDLYLRPTCIFMLQKKCGSPMVH